MKDIEREIQDMELPKATRWNPYQPLLEAERGFYKTRQFLKQGQYPQAKERLQAMVNSLSSIIDDIDSMTTRTTRKTRKTRKKEANMYTKGDWKAEKVSQDFDSWEWRVICYREQGLPIIVADDLNEANARLIAQAPRLYEACKLCVRELQEQLKGTSRLRPHTNEAISSGLQAIASVEEE